LLIHLQTKFHLPNTNYYYILL